MKVDFSVSYPFNNVMARNAGKRMSHEDFKELKEWLSVLETEWRKHESRVLESIEKLSGFGWNEEKVTCFVMKYFPVAGVSYPLILRAGGINERLRVLTHELIHINTPKMFTKLNEDVPDKVYFNHVSVYLVYNEIMDTIFKEIEKYPKTDFENQSYKKAIEKSIELRERWKKSGLDMFEFMKKCQDEKLV